jgi:hypothetical protein
MRRADGVAGLAERPAPFELSYAKAHNYQLEDKVPNWLWIVLAIVGYLVLTQWLLPKLGVPT